MPFFVLYELESVSSERCLAKLTLLWYRYAGHCITLCRSFRALTLTTVQKACGRSPWIVLGGAA